MKEKLVLNKVLGGSLSLGRPSTCLCRSGTGSNFPRKRNPYTSVVHATRVAQELALGRHRTLNCETQERGRRAICGAPLWVGAVYAGRDRMAIFFLRQPRNHLNLKRFTSLKLFCMWCFSRRVYRPSMTIEYAHFWVENLDHVAACCKRMSIFQCYEPLWLL